MTDGPRRGAQGRPGATSGQPGHAVPIAWTPFGGYGWANCLNCAWTGPRRDIRADAEQDAAQHRGDTDGTAV